VPDLGKAHAAADRIFKIIDQPSLINAVEMDKDTALIRIPVPEKIEGKVEFQNVWFRYPSRKEDWVLKGLNITINPNEAVALVGESGCGKSTFVSLLMRFYDVDDGEILLDGVNIKKYNLHDLRSAISLVMQEPIIFNYTILENILYGKLQAKNSEIMNVCEISNALEFIMNKDAIDGNDLEIQQKKAKVLKGKMDDNKDGLVALIGQKKYDEEIEILEKLEK